MSDLTDKIKTTFFKAVVILILLYGCTTWMLTKRLKKLDGDYARMLLTKCMEQKARLQLHKNAVSCIEQVLEAKPPQKSSCTATYHPSRKLSQLDEPDMWDTAGEIRMNS